MARRPRRLTSVILGPLTFSIEDVDELDGPDQIGMFDPRNARICVARSMPDPVWAETLIHEIVHGFFQYHYAAPMTAEQEESVVSSMANGLCAFLRSNPGVLDKLGKMLVLDEE